VSIEQVKDLFGKPPDLSASQGREPSELINMRAIKEILEAQPFSLSPEQAVLISRYIVEDSPNEYVYEDENN
jgi:hypothetical protein